MLTTTPENDCDAQQCHGSCQRAPTAPEMNDKPSVGVHSQKDATATSAESNAVCFVRFTGSLPARNVRFEPWRNGNGEVCSYILFASIGAPAQAVCTDVGSPIALQLEATAVRATRNDCNTRHPIQQTSSLRVVSTIESMSTV